jgi:hypothetical protein
MILIKYIKNRYDIITNLLIYKKRKPRYNTFLLIGQTSRTAIRQRIEIELFYGH